MLDNATYNLIETAAHISKGLHRYETFKADAQGCQECEGLWAGMQIDQDLTNSNWNASSVTSRPTSLRVPTQRRRPPDRHRQQQSGRQNHR
jgi:hypothetical protein